MTVCSMIVAFALLDTLTYVWLCVCVVTVSAVPENCCSGHCYVTRTSGKRWLHISDPPVSLSDEFRQQV